MSSDSSISKWSTLRKSRCSDTPGIDATRSTLRPKTAIAASGVVHVEMTAKSLPSSTLRSAMCAWTTPDSSRTWENDAMSPART